MSASLYLGIIKVSLIEPATMRTMEMAKDAVGSRDLGSRSLCVHSQLFRRQL